MSFAIYFPHKTGANLQHFHEAALSDLLDDVSPEWMHFERGPDNLPGVAAHWLKRPILHEDFDWTRIGPSGAPRFFLGLGDGWSPASFARAHQQLGKDLTFADGHAWHVPLARQLPSVLQLDEGGRWQGKIAPAYQSFWDQSWEALRWFSPDAEGMCSIDYQAGADFVSLALSVNYRVNRDIVSRLGLIRSDLLFRVVEVVTQYKELLGAGVGDGEKKTDPPG
ncbi:MAG TPA: hypothetical protein VG826_29250 [Pirellulales bacterium]|nr:hypothetical protein [Pirellulales bacterium]